MSEKRADIFNEISAERLKQDAKWGEQNLPSVTEDPQMKLNELYEIPSEERAKHMYQHYEKLGLHTWGHIALEEFCEVIEAPTEAHRRKELIQLAAVLIAQIECIDRHTK